MATVHKAIPLRTSTAENGNCDCRVTDVVEENNTNAVQSGAVYNHVAVQVGNIEILLETI